jgi:hypothetical protein
LGVKRFFFASLKEIIITTITIKNKLINKKEKRKSSTGSRTKLKRKKLKKKKKNWNSHNISLEKQCMCSLQYLLFLCAEALNHQSGPTKHEKLHS